MPIEEEDIALVSGHQGAIAGAVVAWGLNAERTNESIVGEGLLAQQTS
jgi:hypothetical protein